MYLTTYQCGISTEHLESRADVSNIITSIVRYHVYYHMRRFMRDPSLMTKYISSGMLPMLSRNLAYRNELVDKLKKFSGSIPDPDTWRNTFPDKYLIINQRYAITASGKAVGIYYQLTNGNTRVENNKGGKNFLRFIARSSNGLTKFGQTMLQRSIESYVYCVLGSQAETRWPIVGRGAMSLQTQEVFHKLVADTVIQDDHTIAISNMRKSIKDTNVILNMAISPGIILIPSDMIILTEMVPGYNNILTLAGKGMKFGVNDAVNYLRPVVKDDSDKPVVPTTSEIKKRDGKWKLYRRVGWTGGKHTTITITIIRSGYISSCCCDTRRCFDI